RLKNLCNNLKINPVQGAGGQSVSSARSISRSSAHPPRKNMCMARRESLAGSDYRVKAPNRRQKQEKQTMKYILLMSGTKAGVSHYRAWSKQDAETHM